MLLSATGAMPPWVCILVTAGLVVLAACAWLPFVRPRKHCPVCGGELRSDYSAYRYTIRHDCDRCGMVYETPRKENHR